MKYKVGDKVKVREDLEEERYYGKNSFTSGMKDYKGKVVTIEKCTNPGYMIEEDKIGWHFTDEMFEGLVKENQEPHKGCEFCNDDFYRAYTNKNGSIKFNKVKVSTICICVDGNNLITIAKVNSDKRIEPNAKVKLDNDCEVIVLRSIKIMDKYLDDLIKSLYNTGAGAYDEVRMITGVFKETEIILEEL